MLLKFRAVIAAAAGSTIGSRIRRNTYRVLAPMMLAASSSEELTEAKDALSIRRVNGILTVTNATSRITVVPVSTAPPTSGFGWS